MSGFFVYFEQSPGEIIFDDHSSNIKENISMVIEFTLFNDSDKHTIDILLAYSNLSVIDGC